MGLLWKEHVKRIPQIPHGGVAPLEKGREVGQGRGIGKRLVEILDCSITIHGDVLLAKSFSGQL
jgi:hypothetical protein